MYPNTLKIDMVCVTYIQQIQMYPNTLKIDMVCVTYIQQIYFSQHSFSHFIYLYYIVLKKNEMRVKTGQIQQIKKNYGSVIFCKASFIFNWKHFNTLWVFFSFFYLYKNKVELFISHS